jgi:hypothetical protein
MGGVRLTARGPMLVGATLLAALIALAGVGGAAPLGTAALASAETRTYAHSLAGRITVLQRWKLEQAAIQWRGGPITTSTGETVQVLVSTTLPPEVTPEAWAEFLVKMVHGSELARFTMHIAPFTEVQQLCGGRAVGCYSRDEAVSIGEILPNGTTPEEVVRHEYGHHIALYRLNSPWRAIDWGPKHWASAANICAKVTRKEAFPGDEGMNYALNPGEGWAEVYRLMDERKAGVASARWQIVSRGFFPNEAALQAAERDVLQPWTAGKRSVVRRQFTRKGQVWWIPLSTPLDGSFSITVNLPRGGLHAVALVAGNRRTLLRRPSSPRPRLRTIGGNICGQRSLYLRVTQKGAFGQVTAAISTP